MDTRASITSAIEIVTKCNPCNLYVDDVYDDDCNKVIGIFMLMYDSSRVPYVASLVDGIMNISAIKSMMLKVIVDKVEGVYSFPVNSPNVSRVTLIELYKKLEALWVARNTVEG